MKKKPELVLFSARGRASLPEHLAQRLEAAAAVTYSPTLHALSDDELVVRCQGARVVGLTRRACKDFHGGLVDRLPGLAGLAVYATGAEWLDTRALSRRQVRWRILPDYSAQTVAEHAVAMLLALSRRLHLSDRVVRGELPATVSLRGWELAGKRVGIVGLGRIGRRIARLVAAFDAQVVYFDPGVAVAEYSAVSWEALFAGCDAVMLAASVQREAPPIVDAECLALMKRGAYLVNPSRPQLVDRDAARLAILAGHLAGYAVDEHVYSDEELAGVEPGRILQTGHTGWYSDEAMARGAESWVANLIELAETL